MSNYGLGVGSFLTGLTQGVKARSILDKSDEESRLNDLRIRAGEAELGRDTENQTYLNRQRALAEQARVNSAPLIEAKRNEELATLDQAKELRDTRNTAYDADKKSYDELRGRSILKMKDAQGKEHTTVDGEEVADATQAERLFQQKNGSFSDYLSRPGGSVEATRNSYLRQGDLKTADAFDAWRKQKEVQRAENDYGAGLQALTMGDYRRASEALNRVTSNGAYVPTDHHRVTFTPIFSSDEVAGQNKIDPNVKKYNGIQLTYEDKAGNRSVKDFTDQGEMFRFFSTALHPSMAFDVSKMTYEAGVKAKAEGAERADKLANEIVLKRYESDFKIAEKRAEREGLDPKEIRQSMHDIMEDDTNSGGKTLQKPVLGKDGKPVRDDEGRIQTEPLQGRERVQAAYDMAVDLYRGGRTASQRPMAGGDPAQGGGMGAQAQPAALAGSGTVAPRRVLRRDMGSQAPVPQQRSAPQGRSIVQRQPLLQDYFAKIEGMQKPKAQADEAQARYDAEYVASKGFDPRVYTAQEVDDEIERRARNSYMR